MLNGGIISVFIYYICTYIFPSPSCNLESISEAIEMLLALSLFLGWLSLLAVFVQFNSHLEHPSIQSFFLSSEKSPSVCFEIILVSWRHPLQLNTFFSYTKILRRIWEPVTVLNKLGSTYFTNCHSNFGDINCISINRWNSDEKNMSPSLSSNYVFPSPLNILIDFADHFLFSYIVS